MVSLDQAAVDPKSFIPGRASDKITLLHFSDVADLETGAARFVTSVKSVKEESSPLILFSGNAFSPSMSMTTGCLKKTLLRFNLFFLSYDLVNLHIQHLFLNPQLFFIFFETPCTIIFHDNTTINYDY